MKPIVRTVTEVGNAAGRARPLSAFRGDAALVLLGDPGSGKTFEFRKEVEALGDAALYFSARKFLRSPPEQSVADTTLFIDGLDEVRAGPEGPRAPLDGIVSLLRRIGRPRVRLSCRAADWFGRMDAVPLGEAAPAGEVKVLRLEPLRDIEIDRLARSLSAPTETDAFLKVVQRQGLYGALRHPLALRNALRAFGSGGGGWPGSRREVLEAACLRLATEHNKEHLHSGKEQFAAVALVDVAGALDAALLLGGAEGCSLYANDGTDDWPALESLAPSSGSVARAALGTALFTAESEDDRFAPMHRQVAEFLGGRYLAHRVEEGLPVGRVLALLTTGDGVLPTPLRGLAAWLATRSPAARERLLETDPFAVAAYGDIREFSPEEKHRLLRSMQGQKRGLDTHWSFENLLAPLAAPEVAPALREVLESPDREDAAQLAAGIVLRAWVRVEPMPEVTDILLMAVRDGTRWPTVNRCALDAFLHNCVDEGLRSVECRRLLDDIRAGVVPDADRELLGTLLELMYPAQVGPEELWDCLLEQPTQLLGGYVRFWREGLTRETRHAYLPTVLSALKERPSSMWSVFEKMDLEDLPMRLVGKTLAEHGDKTSASEIYTWLRIGPGSPLRSVAHDRQAIGEIRAWLEGRPHTLKRLWKEAWKQCPESDEFLLAVRDATAILGIADRPEGFGRFCFDEAIRVAQNRPRLAEWLLEQAIERAAEEGIGVEEFIDRVRKQMNLVVLLPRLTRTDLAAGYLDERDQDRSFAEARRRNDSALVRLVQEEEQALRGNRAQPKLLEHLAWQYLESLKEYMSAPGGGWRIADPGLRQVVIEALARAPWRDDVPDEDEIFRLHGDSRRHYLAVPFLAGLEVAERRDSTRLATLNDEQRKQALAFYYIVPTGRLETPNWYREIARSRPALTAKILVRWAKAEFATGEANPVHLHSLLRDDHAEVAGQAALPLLSGFSVRSQGGQLQTLDLLLWAALARADRTKFLRIVERKVGSKSMTVAQRPHWVAAGLAAAPDEYRERFEALTRDEEAARAAAMFLCPQHATTFPNDETDSGILQLLIARLGAMFAPPDSFEAGIRLWTEWATDRVDGFIRRLGSRAGRAAGESLGALLQDPELGRWKGRLEVARDQQRIVSRDAHFRHAPAGRVAEALRGGRPANAPDLSAFVAHHLDDLAAEFAGGDGNGWRPFWNEDSFGRPVAPKPEESCRDALLGALRGRLGSACRIEPEARHAGGARSDLLVRCDGFAVPIEIKREGHPELWTAVSEQLIPRYTAMPEAAGSGIYLVLWFGHSNTVRPPKGIRPETREQLHRRLVENLTPEERDRIEVRVLDVRPPAARRAEAEAG